MENLIGKVALVTGATSGIGEAISRKLVEKGLTVIGCVRDVRKIQVIILTLPAPNIIEPGSVKMGLEASAKNIDQEIAKNVQNCGDGSLTAIECDVSKEEDVMAMFEKIRKQYGGLDFCICNAGISYTSSILTGQTEHWKHMFDVNVIGVLMCCRESVKAMKYKGMNDGHIIVICGESGHRILPNKDLHVYCATKHAVRAIAEGVRRELGQQKLHTRVTTISPGMTETQFLYRRFSENPEIAEKLYATKNPLQCEDVTESVLHCLTAPPRAQIEEILLTPTAARF